MTAAREDSQPIIELRVPFTVDRAAVDDVERGAKDSDWQPLKDAARKIAFAEDRAVFEGYAAAGIVGIRESSSNPALALPDDALAYPNIISQAVSSLRLAGVNGPYSVLLSRRRVHHRHRDVGPRLPHSRAPGTGRGRGDHLGASDRGGFVLSTRGGDYELRVGQDLSIGYLSHDAASVQLYFQESLTFFVYTSEAAVALTAPAC